MKTENEHMKPEMYAGLLKEDRDRVFSLTEWVLAVAM